MECVFSDSAVFVKIMEGIKDLCNEGNLDFNDQGMAMQVMDAAHVSLCSMLMRTKLFKSYVCPQPVSLGVNFRTLSMVLKGAKGELKLKNVGDTLQVTVQKQTGVTQYTMNLMDLDCEHLAVPETEYQAVCVLPSGTFGSVVKDLSDFSDTCTMHIGETLTMSAKGDLGKVVWKADDCKCNLLCEVEPLQFALRYMCLFSKCAVSPKALLSMSPDMPLSLTFPIETSGFMRFYLAPKTVE